MIVVELPGQPRGKGRPRSRVAWTKQDKPFVAVYTDVETRRYETALAYSAKAVMHSRAPLEEPLAVVVEARFAIPVSWPNKRRDAALVGAIRPTGAPDADNIAKVLDALNTIVWHDDAQIVDLSIRKLYSETPCLRIEVRPLGVFDAVEERADGEALVT